MKHLRSSIEDLRRIFERSITVRDIAEPFVSFDANYPCEQVRQFMIDRGYDIIGVRSEGLIDRYAVLDKLSSENLNDCSKTIEPKWIMPDSGGLLDVFGALSEQKWFFVSIMGRVWGVVTRADLQKAPVRMWLFGIISLVEMHLSRLMREFFPREEWKDSLLLKAHRLASAEKLFLKRQREKQETDLTDCLQFCDKATILHKRPTHFAELGFASNTEALKFFSKLEKLRNALAHSQDIVTNHWPKLAELTSTGEKFLRACEKRSPKRFR